MVLAAARARYQDMKGPGRRRPTIRPGPGAEERVALLVKSGSEVIAVVVLPGTALGVDRR